MNPVMEQASLEGFDPAVEPTDRLFLAVFPTEAAAEKITQLGLRLRGEQGLKGKLIQKERLHVTLHHLGDHVGLRQDIVTAAAEVAAGIAAEPFEVTFDHASSFASQPRNRPFVLRGREGVEPLIAFQRTVGEAMKRSTLNRWAKSSFTPHVTLMYDDRAVEGIAIEPVSWQVHELVLVHSLLRQTRHVILGRWPLRAAA